MSVEKTSIDYEKGKVYERVKRYEVVKEATEDEPEELEFVELVSEREITPPTIEDLAARVAELEAEVSALKTSFKS